MPTFFVKLYTFLPFKKYIWILFFLANVNFFLGVWWFYMKINLHIGSYLLLKIIVSDVFNFNQINEQNPDENTGLL